MLRRLLNRLAAWLILHTITDDDATEIIIEGDIDGDPNHIHVIPDNDLIEHETELDDDCPCGPEVQPVEREDGSMSWLYHHSALDGRDLEEDGQGVPCLLYTSPSPRDS